jgi:hypothetical protein
VTESTLAELEFLFTKKGDVEREIGEPECERTTSDVRREVVEGRAGEPVPGEPDGVEIEVDDVSANRGGGSSGSSSTAGSGSGCTSGSGRILASTGGNS